MSVESFMTDWEQASKETLEYFDSRIFNDKVVVSMSPSGRQNTIRIRAVRSLELKKGHATAFYNWVKEKAKEHKVDVRLAAQTFGWITDEMPKDEQVVAWCFRMGMKKLYEYPERGVEFIFYGSSPEKMKKRKPKTEKAA